MTVCFLMYFDPILCGAPNFYLFIYFLTNGMNSPYILYIQTPQREVMMCLCRSTDFLSTAIIRSYIEFVKHESLWLNTHINKYIPVMRSMRSDGRRLSNWTKVQKLRKRGAFTAVPSEITRDISLPYQRIIVRRPIYLLFR